ncbi:phage integrase SAM-like domain-containing protein [Pontibacter pamirensis]|uniref:phage integrase SAM-like domain-containing protein n=1 Tax=Pontibacter pamirensis TaxID=2562824 RepID=UPI001389B45B|nr:phage integrase SAM-like domain-containing protein [Pontibacter pamirensis]
MSVSIRFYLHNKTSKDGKSIIYIRVHGASPLPMALSTGESVVREAWNHEGQKVTGRKVRYSTEINARLERMAHRVASEFRERLDAGEELGPDDLRLLVRPQAKFQQEKPRLMTVRDFYEDWAAWYLQGKPNAGDYTRGYKQIVDKMHEHSPKLRPKDISLEWIETFERWLKTEYTLASNTLLRYRKVYRLVRKRAGLPFDWIETGSMRASDKFALWWEEVLQLRDHTYSSEELQYAAEAFVINCELGLRWGDMERVRPDHFFEQKTNTHGTVKVLRLTQGKTQDDVMVPVPPVAHALLEKHGWLIPVPRTRTGTSYRHKYVDNLKDAAEEAKLVRKVRTRKVYADKVVEGSTPIHKKISTHIARHTAGTLMERHGSRELASVLLGHAERGTTQHYIHRDQVRLVEQMLEAWDKIEKGV